MNQPFRLVNQPIPKPVPRSELVPGDKVAFGEDLIPVPYIVGDKSADSKFVNMNNGDTRCDDCITDPIYRVRIVGVDPTDNAVLYDYVR